MSQPQSTTADLPLGNDQLEDLGFDPQALRAKYLKERDKRVRADGKEQYQSITDEYQHYLQDPYAPPLTREPVSRELDVFIIGGGFGGMLSAVRLLEAGVSDFVMVEKAGDFGGTWYWNRYPGIQCDIESYVYIPLLEEMNYIPSERYAHGQEIFEHAQAVGRRYGLYERAYFQTEVTDLRWDDEAMRWNISTDRGDKFSARFVCMSTGPLQRPKLPGIPGINDFKGHSFHTSRWDYSYTGGDMNGNLDGLKDKAVGIIGTGATSIQVVPHLAASAKHLYVFQRTPITVAYRGNRPTDPEWAKSLTPGWQQERMDNFNAVVHGVPVETDMVDDSWTYILSSLTGPTMMTQPELGQIRDYQLMEEMRARIDSEVKDPKIADALKPWYNIMCKRPGFHDQYLASFNRSNVSLVDMDGASVERITENGLVANGKEYPLDCIIYATGFEFQTRLSSRNGYEIHGRGGLPLSEKWKEGLSTLWGYHIRDFPNCFILGNGQSANTPNFTHMLNEASRHIAYVVRHCIENNIAAIEPTPEAEQGWVDHVMSFAGMKTTYDRECTPSYYNNEGVVTDEALTRNAFYPGGAVAFIKILREMRESGDFSQFHLHPVRAGAAPR